MPAKKHKRSAADLTGPALLKETNRRIRAAMRLWDAHRNAACRGERAKALALYERLTEQQRKQVPEQLRVWLRFRSEKYFGTTKSGGNGAHEKVLKQKRGKPSNADTQPDDPETAGEEDEWAGVGL